MSQAQPKAHSTASEQPNAEELRNLLARADEGPVVMLNLLKFKPDVGEAMYLEYGTAVGPLLARAGARVLYMGQPGELLIGSQRWDSLILVEYPTRRAFIEMIGSPEYRAIQHLRDLSLERSVLYATNPMPLPGARG